MINRRQLWANFAAAIAGAETLGLAQEKHRESKPALPLKDFPPKSMLHTHVTRVPKARFPLIGLGTFRRTWSCRRPGGGSCADIPKTQFVCLHVADSENLTRASAVCLAVWTTRDSTNPTSGFSKRRTSILPTRPSPFPKTGAGKLGIAS